MKATLDAAVAALRAGDTEPIEKLSAAGSAVVPYLGAYLHDPDDDVRWRAVSIAAGSGDASAIPLLLEALADADQSIVSRAALALYRRFSPTAVMSAPGAARILAACVDGGQRTAAAILLLGNDGPEAAPSLRRVVESGDGSLSELESWTPVVSSALVARVALARLGDPAALTELTSAIPRSGLDELRFLLEVIAELDDPAFLQLLASTTLSDTRPVQAAAPSGVSSGWRLCDAAVSAFVKALSLPVRFALRSVQPYEATQVEEVKGLFARSRRA